ncbi:cell number regulator 2-like [Rhododendron vialii]|uniref:cell number regulator 2-like n=1 Tax=Rhododendron vialii TaxID=182163 RepID=UPI00265D7C42|nr:cell number regulator 2-like [Rhododendron vialii]
MNSSNPPVPWSSGLYDCFDDVPNCCITYFCPCITFGRIAEIVNKGETSCRKSGGIYASLSLCRSRRRYSLPETPYTDWCVHGFCEPCALCQEYRELKKQGFDMSIGWEGNLERKRCRETMAPMAEGGMTTRDK